MKDAGITLGSKIFEVRPGEEVYLHVLGEV